MSALFHNLLTFTSLFQKILVKVQLSRIFECKIVINYHFKHVFWVYQYIKQYVYNVSAVQRSLQLASALRHVCALAYTRYMQLVFV